jgi:hypothetical protein
LIFSGFCPFHRYSIEMLSFFLFCKINQRLYDQMADVRIFFCLWLVHQGLIICAGFVHFTSFFKRNVRFSLLSWRFCFFIVWFVVNRIFLGFWNQCFLINCMSFFVALWQFTYSMVFIKFIRLILGKRIFYIRRIFDTGFTLMIGLLFLCFLEILLEFLSFRYLFLKNGIIHVLKRCYKTINGLRDFLFSVFAIGDKHLIVLRGG